MKMHLKGFVTISFVHLQGFAESSIANKESLKLLKETHDMFFNCVHNIYSIVI